MRVEICLCANCVDLAECIAEFTGRPLLSLTCGDLGNNETSVEEHLSKWFKLAERWGAVMLLDEADVYTEKRMVADLNRNSMVSGKQSPWFLLLLSGILNAKLSGMQSSYDAWSTTEGFCS
jgi:hypothetical protein